MNNFLDMNTLQVLQDFCKMNDIDYLIPDPTPFGLDDMKCKEAFITYYPLVKAQIEPLIDELANKVQNKGQKEIKKRTTALAPDVCSDHDSNSIINDVDLKNVKKTTENSNEKKTDEIDSKNFDKKKRSITYDDLFDRLDSENIDDNNEEELSSILQVRKKRVFESKESNNNSSESTSDKSDDSSDESSETSYQKPENDKLDDSSVDSTENTHQKQEKKKSKKN